MSNPFGSLLSGLGNLEGVYPGQVWQQRDLGQYVLTASTAASQFYDYTKDAMVLRVGETAPVVEGGYRHPEREWLDRRVNEMRVKL